MVPILSLFSGIPPEHHPALWARLEAVRRRYDRHAYVFFAGRESPRCGVLLSGSVELTRDEADGTQTLVEQLFAGEVFGLPFALRQVASVPFSCRCREASEILFFNPRAAASLDQAPCPGQQRLLDNLMLLLTDKTLQMQRKVDCLSCRTIRERVLVWLRNSPEGETTFNRGELARYLCVDRCALSRELAKMRREGLISFAGRRFEINEEA